MCISCKTYTEGRSERYYSDSMLYILEFIIRSDFIEIILINKLTNDYITTNI